MRRIATASSVCFALISLLVLSNTSYSLSFGRTRAVRTVIERKYPVNTGGSPGSVKVSWTYDAGGRSPAAGPDGTVYFASYNNKKVIALNQAGTLKWEWTNSDNDNLQGGITVGRDCIYTGSVNSKLYAIDYTTGLSSWAYAISGADNNISGIPAVSTGGVVYFCSSSPDFYALNPDGSLKWKYTAPSGEGLTNSPVIDSSGTVYFGCRDSKLYALGQDGSKKWDFSTGVTDDWVTGTPAIGSGGVLYFGSRNNNFFAVSSTGSKIWEYAAGDDIEASAAIGSDGTVYIGSNDGKLYALNPDGTLKWYYAITPGHDITSAPLIDAGGNIYFIGHSTVYALDDDGALLWEYSVSGGIGIMTNSSPGIGAAGDLYIGAEGRTYAIDIDAAIAASPWPKMQHDAQNTGRQ